jgi:hypothetical protein
MMDTTSSYLWKSEAADVIAVIHVPSVDRPRRALLVGEGGHSTACANDGTVTPQDRHVGPDFVSVRK